MSLIRVVVVSVLAAGAVVAGGHRADAALPGAELVWSAPAPASSETTRIAVAACPSGKRLAGLFAFTWGNTRDVVITALVPVAGAGYAIAHEDQDGTADDWGLTVQLVCAAPVPGLTIVNAVSAYDSANKQVTATCPAGKRLMASGWAMTDSDGEVFLNQVAQSSALDRVSITGMEDQDGHAGAWRLTTYGLCADPLPGLELRTASSATDSADKSVLLVCGSGQRRLSAGWSLVGSGGGSPAGQVLAQPGSSGTNWYELIAHEDDDGYAGWWVATGRIVCVTV